MTLQHTGLPFAIAVCIAAFVTNVHAQQNFAKDLRGDSVSARIATLPTEPGKLETYFVNVKDGDVVRSPFRIVFGLIGLGVSPAGIKKEGTGHHHLLIDTPMPSDLKTPIPFSEKYRHFGGGQTETTLELSPGMHTLQLLFADEGHIPFYKTKNGTEVVVHSRKINIVVEGPQTASN